MADDSKLRLTIWEAAADFFDDKIDANHPDYVRLERAFDAAIDALIAAVRAEQTAQIETLEAAYRALDQRQTAIERALKSS